MQERRGGGRSPALDDRRSCCSSTCRCPGLDGFGVLHALGPSRVPATIFVTAYDTYALRAFEVEALDYILKPFDETRFNAAFDKARRRIAERRTARWAQRLLAATKDRDTGALAALPRLAVPIGQRVGLRRFRPDHVDPGVGPGTSLIHAGAKEHLLRETLQHLAARLPRERFARIHRSHVVNLAKVRDLRRLQNGDGIVTLDDGQELRMSRRYRRALPK